MTNMKPATDEEIAFCLASDGMWTTFERMLAARIDADREEIAATAHLIAEGIKVVNEQAAEIASLKASGGQITDSERQMHAADRRMNDALRSEIAALKAEVERLTHREGAMNVPGIRKALKRIRYEHSIRSAGNSAIVYLDAVTRVGLRACDEALKKCGVVMCHGVGSSEPCRTCYLLGYQIAVIADILREAGVEVEG